MRIAITADPYIPVPPKFYGGIERVLALLVDGLVANGHDVVLLGHPESNTEARLVPYGAPPHTGRVDRTRELFQVGTWLWRHSHELDVVHSFGRLAALLPILPQTRLVKIQSYQRAIPWAGVHRAVRLARQSLSFTGCSTAMYKNSIAGEWHTVYNCVDVDRFDFKPRVPDNAPLMFLGRIESIKGTHEAIQIALQSGSDLVVAGNRVDEDGGYFEDKVEPFIDGRQIRYVGPVDDEAKNALLGRASAFLMPIGWEEPFGIVMGRSASLWHASHWFRPWECAGGRPRRRDRLRRSKRRRTGRCGRAHSVFAARGGPTRRRRAVQCESDPAGLSRAVRRSARDPSRRPVRHRRLYGLDFARKKMIAPGDHDELFGLGNTLEQAFDGRHVAEWIELALDE